MSSRSHYILTALGSAGDLVPMLTLGQSLQARGHRVTVLTTGIFDNLVASCGLANAPWIPCGFPERALRDVWLLGTRFHGLFFRRHAVAWNAALLRFLSSLRPEKPILITAERPLVWADLYCHLNFGFPCVRLVMDPPPAPGAAAHVANNGPTNDSYLCRSWQYDWIRAARLQGHRAGSNHVARLNKASQRTVPRIALWPEWFAPRVLRPPSVQSLGFIAGPNLEAISPFNQTDTRRPLIVFLCGSLGTTRNWEQRFAAVSRNICQELDCDGLLLGGTPPRDGIETPSFRWNKHVPLDVVLPAATGIVHHGGIGTASSALRHGVPQLIVPRIFSQPSTAEWMRRLGVASVLQPAEFEVGTALPQLFEITQNPSYRQRSVAYAGQIDAKGDLERLSNFVEQLHSSQTTNRRYAYHGITNN